MKKPHLRKVSAKCLCAHMDFYHCYKHVCLFKKQVGNMCVVQQVIEKLESIPRGKPFTPHDFIGLGTSSNIGKILFHDEFEKRLQAKEYMPA
jgi:hypothetical protein